jgi:hypothetical protein
MTTGMIAGPSAPLVLVVVADCGLKSGDSSAIATRGNFREAAHPGPTRACELRKDALRLVEPSAALP